MLNSIHNSGISPLLPSPPVHTQCRLCRREVCLSSKLNECIVVYYYECIELFWPRQCLTTWGASQRWTSPTPSLELDSFMSKTGSSVATLPCYSDWAPPTGWHKVPWYASHSEPAIVGMPWCQPWSTLQSVIGIHDSHLGIPMDTVIHTWASHRRLWSIRASPKRGHLGPKGRSPARWARRLLVFLMLIYCNSDQKQICSLNFQ